MISFLCTYSQEAVTDVQPLWLPDDYDGDPYGDHVPVVVGSNQTIRTPDFADFDEILLRWADENFRAEGVEVKTPFSRPGSTLAQRLVGRTERDHWYYVGGEKREYAFEGWTMFPHALSKEEIKESYWLNGWAATEGDGVELLKGLKLDPGLYAWEECFYGPGFFNKTTTFLEAVRFHLTAMLTNRFEEWEKQYMEAEGAVSDAQKSN